MISRMLSINERINLVKKYVDDAQAIEAWKEFLTEKDNSEALFIIQEPEWLFNDHSYFFTSLEEAKEVLEEVDEDFEVFKASNGVIIIDNSLTSYIEVDRAYI